MLSWSFGIVVYEVFSLGAQPYTGVPHTELYQLIADGYRLPHSQMALCPAWLYDEIVTACWRLSPSARPSFEDTHNTIVKHCLLIMASECEGYVRGDY